MGEAEELARNKAAALRIFKNTIAEPLPGQMETKKGRESARAGIVQAIGEMKEGKLMVLENDFDLLLYYATKQKPEGSGVREIKQSLKDELSFIVVERRVDRDEVIIENTMSGVAGNAGTPKDERDRMLAEKLVAAGESDIQYVRKAARAIEERTSGLTFAVSEIDAGFEREFNKQLGMMGSEMGEKDPREESKAKIREDVKKIVNDCYNYRGMLIPPELNDEQVRELVLAEIDNRILKVLLDAKETDKEFVRQTFQGSHAATWSPERVYLNAELNPETFLERFDRAAQKNREVAKTEFEAERDEFAGLGEADRKALMGKKVKDSENTCKDEMARITAQIKDLKAKAKTGSGEEKASIEKDVLALESARNSAGIAHTVRVRMIMGAETMQRVEDKLGKDWKQKILVELATGFLPESNVKRLSEAPLDDKKALELLTTIESMVNKIKARMKKEGVEQKEKDLASRTYHAGVKLTKIVGNSPFSDLFGNKLMAIQGTGADGSHGTGPIRGKAAAKGKFSVV